MRGGKEVNGLYILCVVCIVVAVIAIFAAIKFRLETITVLYCLFEKTGCVDLSDDDIKNASSAVGANIAADIITKFSNKSRDEIIFEYFSKNRRRD